MVTIEPTRIGRRAISNVCAPVPPAGLSSKDRPRLLPPRPAVVRAQLAEPPGALDDLARPAELVEPLARASDGDRGDEHAGDYRNSNPDAEPSRPEGALRIGQPVAALYCEMREPERCCGAEHQGEREPCAGAVARGARLEIFDETVLRRRPSPDHRRWHAARDQHREALEPVARQRQPEADAERGDDEPCTRVREHERDLAEIEEKHPTGPKGLGMATPCGEPKRERKRHGREQRKRIPVAHWIAQARHAGAVREQPREDLAEQSPAEHAAEQRREHGRRRPRRAVDERARVHAEHGECEVDERAVEVCPRAVGGERPGHRHADPHDERREQRERSHARAGRRRPGPDACEGRDTTRPARRGSRRRRSRTGGRRSSLRRRRVRERAAPQQLRRREAPGLLASR